jgi:1-pyrroline-5-carboxylate dehydrogenase
VIRTVRPSHLFPSFVKGPAPTSSIETVAPGGGSDAVLGGCYHPSPGRRLRHAAGNFYVNDKPTGSIVGQQPFGGARASGTNDKAGSKINLLRWTSARSVKETFDAPRDHTYPHMGEE